MADEAKTGAEASESTTTPDLLNNLKAELNRKTGNLEDQIKKNNEALNALIGQLTPKPTPDANAPKLKDLWYTDPDKAAAIVAEKAKADVRQEMASSSQAAAKEQRIIQNMYAEYPELGDTSSPLYAKAVEIYNALPAEDKTPIAIKASVRDAAVELGVLPKNKRETMADSRNDDFTLNGNNGNSDNQPRRKHGKDELPPETLDFAKAMGINVDDKAVMERIKTNSKRNYGRYQ